MAESRNRGQFGNRKDTREQASKGGKSQGKDTNRENFADNRKKAREAGKEGGSK